MSANTTNYAWAKPDPFSVAESGLWGYILNTLFDDQDTDLKALADLNTALTATVAALPATALVLISTQTASSSSSISFTSLSSTYAVYIIEFYGVYMSSTNNGLQFYTSTDNGSTYLSSYDYSTYWYAGGIAGSTTNAAATINPAGNSPTATTLANGMSGRIEVRNHANASAKTHLQGVLNFYDGTPAFTVANFAGRAGTAQDTDAVKITPTNGGTITAGTFKLYGVKA